jgi:molybdopterin molybdotransferase
MAPDLQPELVLSFEDACACITKHASRVKIPAIESVPLLDGLGRFLAEEIHADRDFPPFDRATRDGYAVRAADLAQVPVGVKLLGSVKAGERLSANLGSLKPGQCVEIMTGAPVPTGADAVVMVEYTRQQGDVIHIERSVKTGENIVPTGNEAHSGQVLLTTGTRISHPQIALAAAVGKTQLSVFKRPSVAILSTGDEIVEIENAPGPSQIRNSNSYSLAAQVIAAGGEPVQLPIAPDERSRLQTLVKEGLNYDLLLLSGGVSMGKYDLVEDVLREFNAEFFFTGALIQPGRPVVFGRATSAGRQTYFFGLPGNPVSTMVTFDLFARKMLQALAGGSAAPQLFAKAKLVESFKPKLGLTRFLPAILSGDHADPSVKLIAWQGSGDLAAIARANCYLVVPPDRELLSAGELVSILQLG